MNNRNLDFLNLRDLKSVAKYYKIEHKQRIKRVELEALIYMAEHVQISEICGAPQTCYLGGALSLSAPVNVGEEYGIDVYDISSSS